MAYCQRCRIGTIDEQGLCRLCGAPQRPPGRLARLAEGGGAVLGTLLQPGVLAAAGIVVFLLVAAVVMAGGVQVPAGVPSPRVGGFLDPGATMAAARQDPLGAALRFLLPAIVQSVLFGLLLLTLVLLLRRRRPEREPRERRLAG